jgi:putative membrane protein
MDPSHRSGLVAFAVVLAILPTACSRSADNAAATAPPPAAVAPADPGNDGAVAPVATNVPPDPAASAAEVLSVIAAIDEHEIDASRVAADRTSSEALKDFAATLHKDHADNLAQAQALLAGAATVDTPLVAAQKRMGAAELVRLEATDAAALDRAYVDAMVAGHAATLALLDRLAAPLAPGAVADFVAATRTVVAAHLARGQALQGTATP